MPGNVTFFAHDYFPYLASSSHEICPHPFITDISNLENELTKLTFQFQHIPTGIRMHTCLFSHMIGVRLHALGYKYASNDGHLFQDDLKPYKHPWGIWEMPIYYMDNMDFWMQKNWPDMKHSPFNPEIIKTAVKGDSLYVFDFHPLHIALNTRTHEDYILIKDKIMANLSPFVLRYNGRGAAVFFEELCYEMTKYGQRSYTCSEALKIYGCA